MRLIAFLLLLSSSLWAYRQDQISITDYEFRRYVRPQLKSISNDFQTLFFALNKPLMGYKGSYSSFKKVNSLNQELRKDCEQNQLTPKCLASLEKLEKILFSVSKDLKSVESLDVKSADKRMRYQHSKELLAQSISRNIFKIQNMSFQVKLTGNLDFDAMGFSDELNYLYDKFHTFLFQNSNELFKNEITSYWANFIRPVETFVLYQNRQDFLKKNLNELNIRWNMLNVRLTKRNYNPNKQISTLLNVMHRRWNNILKVSLNTKG
ncbi:MAG: hypothetical protein KC478_06270 [Bacteriovoracaceae bacterium]|nr:hypothetical protein [Bacteriovoracaceae bacterium]